MPQYTFVCPDGHEATVLCKYSERHSIEDQCPECGKANKYEGRPELIHRRDFGKGAYRMKAVMADGSKKKLSSGGTRGDS